MQVSSTNGTTGSNGTTSGSSGAAKSLDPNQFLSLLMTELQNQDPTSPMQPDQMMSQLATISSVEQSVQTNQKLDSLLTSSALQQAGQVIGQTVTSADGKQSGVVMSVSITSSGPVAKLSDGSQLTLGSGITIG